MQAGERDTDVSLLPSRSSLHRQTRFLWLMGSGQEHEGVDAFVRLYQLNMCEIGVQAHGPIGQPFGQSQRLGVSVVLHQNHAVATLCRILLDGNPCLGGRLLRVLPVQIL